MNDAMRGGAEKGYRDDVTPMGGEGVPKLLCVYVVLVLGRRDRIFHQMQV